MYILKVLVEDKEDAVYTEYFKDCNEVTTQVFQHDITTHHGNAKSDVISGYSDLETDFSDSISGEQAFTEDSGFESQLLYSG